MLSSMEDVISDTVLDSCLTNPVRKEYWLRMSGAHAITCGSVAEFYIEPIESCIGDEDVLYYNSCEIALSGDVPLLPTDIRNYDEEIRCCRLEPYEKYPGFVRLKYVGELKYKWNLNKYEFYEACDTEQSFVKTNQQSCKAYWSKDRNKLNLHIKGPSISFTCRNSYNDTVFSIYCPQWPTEVKDWFYRPRNYGWPTKSTLRMITSMGCHVVGVQHRECRDDQYQWRFSFSLAEVILLRSWTKTQQVVYHMFRFFAKKELIQKDCPKEKEVLCTYHLKTLMLWTCEQESSEWWNSSVIGLCSKMLYKLSDWLQRQHIPNYFIPEANLFHRQIDLNICEATVECIQSLSSPEMLSQWFLYNYLLPYCAKKGWTVRNTYIGNLTTLCSIARFITSKRNLDALYAFDFCSLATRYSLDHNEKQMFSVMENVTNELKHQSVIVGGMPLKLKQSRIYWMSLALTLKAASAMVCKRVLCYKTFLANIITILLRKFTSYWPKCNNFPVNYETRFHERYVYFLRAQEYMAEMPASVNVPEFQLLSRLSIEYLIKSTTSNDSVSEDIRSASFAYMAAICYVTSQYQSAVELCSEILSNPQPFDSNRLSTSKREPLSAGCLIFIDDILNIIGYLLLWKHVLDTLPNTYPEIHLDLRLSPEVFAQYVMIKSMEKLPQVSNVSWNKIPGEFLIDAFLMAVAKISSRDIRIEVESYIHGCKLCVYRRTRSDSELIDQLRGFSLSEDISIRLLMECSFKNMTSLYEDTFENIHFPFSTPAFCYRVVYHYRCQHYDEVLTLCEQILREPDIGAEHKKYPFLIVMVLPPFSLYFDDEVQCLIGLQTLCLRLFYRRENITCLHKSQDICCFFCHISKCLNFRRRYLLRRHFLARYLQLRCLIDNNSSVSEVLTAFRKLICQLNFEFIVYEFLRQKLKKTAKHSK